MKGDKDDVERELAETDGMRPDEPEGPEQSEASPARCENSPGVREVGVEESEFEVADQLHEQFPVEQIPMGTDPVDGMPVPMEGDPKNALAVAFTHDTVLCIEDDRTYVELFGPELPKRGWTLPQPPEGMPTPMRRIDDRRPWQTPDGYGVLLVVSGPYQDNGEPRARAEFKPEEVEHLWGVHLVRKDDGWVPVRPVRERCVHYKRQVFSNDDQPDPSKPGHQLVFRVCAARRSNGGACMSLRDEGIYQCDFREPTDERTVQIQDAKDNKKLRERPDLLMVPLFGMPGDAVQIERKPS